MRQIALIITFFATTFAFADTTIATEVTTDDHVDPCLTSANTYTRQACQQMRQAQKARDNPAPAPNSNTTTTQNQTTAPSPNPMPAWQQALQPPVTTTTTPQQNTLTTPDGNAASTTSPQTSPQAGSP